MGSAESIATCGKIILQKKKEFGKNPAVVVSAISGVTDQLLLAAKTAMEKDGEKKMKKIISELEKKHLAAIAELISDKKIRTEAEKYVRDELCNLQNFLVALGVISEMSFASHDRVVALGEKLSAKILAAHLLDKKVKAAFVDLEEIVEEKFDAPDEKFFAHLEEKMRGQISENLASEEIPICTGFFGKIPGGIIAAVGRGYSDFCVAIIGSAFSVREIQIYTDVDGIFSADPRIVKKASVLERISFSEAAEMASFGAKVIHPQTIWPAVKKEIPVRIKNTFNTSAPGTEITKSGQTSGKICKAVTAKKDICIFTIFSLAMPNKIGLMRNIFSVFEKHGISVNLVATAETSVSISVDELPKTRRDGLQKDLKNFGTVQFDNEKAIVCAIGEEMGEKIGSGSKILAAIATVGLNAMVISRNAARNNISCVVENSRAEEIIQKLHAEVLEK